MNASLRRSLVRGLLWIPAVLVVIWFVNQERIEYGAKRAEVEGQARDVASGAAQLIQLRLLQQFEQLETVANAIIGDRIPEDIGGRTEALLTRFAANHPELLDLSIQQADGRDILWSEGHGPERPASLAQDTTSVPGRPDYQLGQTVYAQRHGTRVISMRYRMRDRQGQVLYDVGASSRLDALLEEPQPGDWAITVRDMRDHSVVGSVVDGAFKATGPAARGGVERQITGFPLAVAVHWPDGMVWQAYRHNLIWRLLGRTLVLAFFILAAVVIGRLLRSRERLLAQSARLVRFNAMRAHVNQAILQATEVHGLLTAVCDLAVRDPAIKRAWVGRPAADGTFAVLAAAGESAEDGTACGADAAQRTKASAQCSAAMCWSEGRAVFTANQPGAAVASLPLRRAGQQCAVLHLCGAGPDVFDPDLQRTMQDLAADLSNGLDRLDLLQSQAHLQRQHVSLLDNAVAGVVMVRYPGAIVIEANAAVARIFGVHDIRTVLGKCVNDVAPTLTQDAMLTATRAALKNGRVTLDSLNIIRVDGADACVALSGRRIDQEDAAESTDVVWTIVDVTERQRLMRQMERLSQMDPLTELPNRRALEFNLEHAIARAARRGTAVAIGLIDLDDFKPINDRWGHEVGDALLRQLGQRLNVHGRAMDIVSRLGGDEFVVVIEDLDVEHVQAQLAMILGRLHQAVESPFDLGGDRTATVGMSMGLAIAPIDGESPDALLRMADSAMYRIKSRKRTRAQWWAFAGANHGDDVPEPPFDPFATDAQTLLARVVPVFEVVDREFVEAFYTELDARGDTAPILAALGADELARLKQAQVAHLRFLLAPDTSAAMIQKRAQALGKIHALVGVAPSWLTASMQLYRDMLHWHLDVGDLVARDRYRLQRILDARVQIDLQSQLDAMLDVQNAYNGYLARPLPRAGQDWAEVVDAKLRALGALPGIQGCVVMRPDARGVFTVLASGGMLAESLARLLTTPRLQPSLDANAATGTGTAAVAWRTESVVAVKRIEGHPGLAPWGDAADRLGVRSMAAVPLRRAGQTDAVLLIYGALPNQFDTQLGQTFLAAAQNRWNLVDDQLRRRQPAVGQQEAALYREWLYTGGLQMFVQPIVDLRDGRLAKLEALARLVTPDGEVVLPGKFLGALREADLDALFRIGLSQSLEWLSKWREHGIDVDISLNLPPSTMLNPGCAQWIEDALESSAVSPRHLVLELLESQELDEAMRDDAVATLGQAGIRLAIDDLGSGFNSLKRLASLPFDIIKIDRGILLDIDRDPVKALSLVRTVVQIGRDFEKVVVVEGIENEAIAEAVTILGAGFGQGFGIARPMPPNEFEVWAAQYASAQRARVPGAAPQRLESALAALAFHWLHMHEARPHPEADAHACPLDAFLRSFGADAVQALAWHEVLHHQATDSESSRMVGQYLASWLVARVRDEARERVLESMKPSRGETDVPA